MADQLQLRGGTTAQTNVFTGAQREVTVDTDLNTLVVHDNFTPGGFPMATRAQVNNGTFYFNDNTGGGSAANAYILAAKTNTNRPTQYLDGIQLGFVTANANLAGPSTANFTGLGVKNIKYPGGIDPAAGEIFGRVYLIFDQVNDWLELQRKATSPPPQIRSIGASVSANALAITMAPTIIDFRANSLGSGTVNTRTITSQLSITVPSGATLGTTSATLGRIVVLAVDNAGVVSLAVVNANSTINFDETTLINTTAIGAGSSSVNTVYSSAAMSGVPFRVVGFVELTQPTAGTFTVSPSQIQGQGGQTIIGSPRLGSASQATSSGVAIDITGIPIWAKRITIGISNVSTGSTSFVQIQLGTSSGPETTGYTGTASIIDGTVSSAALSAGILIGGAAGTAATSRNGVITMNLISGNTWSFGGVIGLSDTARSSVVGGIKNLSGSLERIRITTVNGTDVFDSGAFNVFYEG